MGALKDLTKDKVKKMAEAERKGYCVGIKGMKSDEVASVRQCFPELVKIIMEMCPEGSGTA